MNIMLSYRSVDSAFMERIAAHLRKSGMTPWIDKEKIVPGTKWRHELLHELRSCDACIPILSHSYLDSEHCRMEVFIARQFGRKILPVTIDDCARRLDFYEETKRLDDLFIATLDRPLMGLPLDEAAVLDRLTASFRPHNPTPTQHIYVSYGSPDVIFATELAALIKSRGVSTWIGAIDIRIGENWRNAQAKAMMEAAAHLVILDERVTSRDVLRTEILFAEAIGIEVYPIIPPRLSTSPDFASTVTERLRTADYTYQRLADRHFLSSPSGMDDLVDQVINAIGLSSKRQKNRLAKFLGW